MTDYSEEDITHFYNVALDLVDKAGKVVVTAIEDRDKKIAEKSSPTDLVTETDKAVEDLLVSGLKKQFPDHDFIGEEDVSAQSGYVSNFSSKPTWIIDPIDGTMNFVHTNPLVSISVGLTINGKLVIGIINAPCIGKLYAAVKGRGATCNSKPIKVSNCTQLSLAQCILEVWSRDGAESEAKQQANFSSIVSKVHSVRCLGSACLNLAFVAAGNSDIYCHAGIRCWDMAAGALIVQESGGVVLDPSGKDFDLMSRRILVASSQDLANEWISHVDFKTCEYKRKCPDIVNACS